MRTYFQIFACFISIIFVNPNCFGQSKEWISQKSKDKSVTVESCISEVKNNEGDIVPLIEYRAVSIVSVDIQKCISVLKDISKHKAFLRDIKESRVIKLLSDNQMLVYYSFSAPWPFSDYDCVTEMSLIEVGDTATFTLISVPFMYKLTNDDRLIDYEISYQFKSMENGKVKIIIIGKMSPSINVPLWMLRRSMPDHPSETIHKIVSLSNEI